VPARASGARDGDPVGWRSRRARRVRGRDERRSRRRARATGRPGSYAAEAVHRVFSQLRTISNQPPRSLTSAACIASFTGPRVTPNITALVQGTYWSVQL
jgi:hypothetical protein